MPLAIERILRSKYYPTLPQVFSILVFLAILFFAFAGNPHGDTNFAVAVTWYLWWVLLPFSAVVFGRIWCSFCPLSTISRFILRLRKKRGRIGRISTPGYGIWVSGLLLLFLTWAMIAWRIEAMPAAT